MNIHHRPIVTKRPFSRLSDGARHPVVTTNVNVVLADLQAGDLAKRDHALSSIPEYGIDTPLPTGQWLEVAMSECTFGCKVYRDRNGKGVRLAISHHNGYGCDVTQEHIDAGVQHLPMWERKVLAEEPPVEEPLADWERELLYGLSKTDEGHGEEYACTAWERQFLGV